MYASPKRACFVVPRIAAFLPNVRLIHIARHPLRRIESAWKHYQAEGIKRLRPFEESIRDGGFIAHSLYWTQISAFRERFCDDQILNLFFEDMIREPRSVLEVAFRFIGVDTERGDGDHLGWVNASANYQVDRASMRLLRKIPAFARLRSSVPGGLRSSVGSLLKHRVDRDVQWNTEIRDWVIGQIRDDVRKYLEYCGKPADFWDLTKL